jgi:hypothetical protein
MQHKDIIITLIKDHLTNTRLMNGLNALGWHSQEYHLHLSYIIFKLIGISDEKEELFEVYLEWCTKVVKAEIFKDPRLFDEYATEIYCVLLGEAEPPMH